MIFIRRRKYTKEEVNKWFLLYIEEKARRIDAEAERDVARHIIEVQKENYEKRIEALLKGCERSEERSCTDEKE